MKRFGFTMIEVVFIIVILGILATVAVPRMIMSREDACYAKLRTDLSEAQSEITREYTKYFMKGKGLSIKDAEFEKILQSTIGQSTGTGCQFVVNSATNIIMQVGTSNRQKTLTMVVEQKNRDGNDDNSVPPKITCDVKNEMCQKLTGKKSN